MKFNIPAEHRNASGVYVIRNTVNSKVYVGSAVKLWRRYKAHITELSRNGHKNSMLQRFCNKRGVGVLSFELLELVEQIALIECEQKWINHFDSANRKQGFNLVPIAGSNLGMKHTDEARRKMSAAQINRVFLPISTETRERLAAAAAGRSMSEETKSKLREANVGKKHSDESKAAMSATRKGRPGKPHSEETKRKLSEIFAGRKRAPHTEETKQRMSEAARKRRTVTAPSGQPTLPL